MQPYPLARSTFGVEYVSILEHLVASTALKLPNLSEDPLLLDVTLRPDRLLGGWRVHSAFGYLGWLDKAETEEFPQLERIATAQMWVSTWATVAIVEGALEVAVHTGLAPWQIPVNNIAPASLFFDGGNPAVVRPRVSAKYLQRTCQFIGELRLGEEDLQVWADGRLIGLADAPSAIRELLSQAQAKSVSVSARCYLAPGMMAVDLPGDPAQAFLPPPPALASAEPFIHVADPTIWEETIDAEVLSEHVLTPAPAHVKRRYPPVDHPLLREIPSIRLLEDP